MTDRNATRSVIDSGLVVNIYDSGGGSWLGALQDAYLYEDWNLGSLTTETFLNVQVKGRAAPALIKELRTRFRTDGSYYLSLKTTTGERVSGAAKLIGSEEGLLQFQMKDGFDQQSDVLTAWMQRDMGSA